MASVYEKRGTWYIRYKNERGRWTAQASSAVTKTEARRLADDFERKAERIRLGLEPALVVTGDRTVGDIVSWWLENVWIGRPSYPKAKSAISAHILSAPFARKRPQDVTPAEIEHYLEAKQRIPGKKGKPLGAQSLNHLREFMRRAFKAAIGERLMPGPNPIDTVRRWVVPKRLPDFLRFHEVPLVLAALRSKWRDLFATAIYAGLRKGELFGLRKTDVDLDVGVIMVKRSYNRVTTKGKRSDAIPVAAELRPYLEHALRVSPSDLVFPREDGTMHAETTQLEMVLRRALRKAGLASGYRHKCRKPGCGYVEAAADPGLRKCPRHRKNNQLWVTQVVRPIRFHDLRHTTGSLLTMRGANTRFVQRIMRHSDPRMTERYTHLDPAYLHGEMDALMRFQPATAAPCAPQPTPVAATAGAPSAPATQRESAPFVTRLLPEAPEGASAALDGITTSVGIPDVTGGAGYRVRTGDIQLGKLTLYQLS